METKCTSCKKRTKKLSFPRYSFSDHLCRNCLDKFVAKCSSCKKRRKNLYQQDDLFGRYLCLPCYDKFVISRTRLSKSGRKRCPYCKKHKPLDNFTIDYSRGYFNAYCKPCDKITSENYRMYGVRTLRQTD